jgi:hypothetical protein
MSFYYSAATGGFYHRAVHSEIPSDAVEISVEDHAALLAKQAAGLTIQADEHGRPVAVPPPPPDSEMRAMLVRNQRDRLLRESDHWMLPDRPLSPAERNAWARYRELLRHLPESPGFPATVKWPVIANRN